jgi:hypothetical protein
MPADQPRQLAEIYEYSQLLHALRVRRDELQISHTTIDDVGGFSPGYASKVLSDPPMRGLGPVSFGLILGALGMKILLVEDYEALLRVRKGFKKRLITGGAVEMQKRMLALGEQYVVSYNFLRKMAARGADMRNHKLSARKRHSLARKAAKARWRKPRVVEITESASSPPAT